MAPVAAAKNYAPRSAALLDEALQQDAVVHVVIHPALEADGDGAVDDVEAAMALDLSGVRAELLAELTAVGVGLIEDLRAVWQRRSFSEKT
jgi:hypothetical protein